MTGTWAAPGAASQPDDPHPAFSSLTPPKRRGPDRRAVALLVASCVVLAGGVVAAVRMPADPPADPAAINALVPELRAFVEKERGLTFTDEVEVELLDDAEFRDRLLGSEDDSEGDDEVEGDEATLKALGLIDDDVDLAADLEKLTGAAVVGFYDTDSNELVVRGGEVTPAVRVTLVHELVHALQDQRLGIDRFDAPEFADREDEAPLGALALIEGDADHVESEYYDTLSQDEQRAVDEEQSELGGDLDDIAPVLPVLLSFPYQVGPELVKTLLAAGGQERLDAAYRNPPVSTEQLLDTEKYLRGEKPLAVRAPKADGKVVDEGAFGQLGLTLLLLRGGVSHADALRAAEGWGGDAYVTWRDGDESCARLAVRGDTPSDSTEIAEALDEWADDGAEVVTAGGLTTVTSCR